MNNKHKSAGGANNSSDHQKTLAHARAVAQRIHDAGIDITKDYDAWLHVSFALASLGEDGRHLFHLVSEAYEGYNYEEVEEKFTNVLNSYKRGNTDVAVSIATFFKIAQDNNIDISLPDELKGKPGRPKKNSEEDKVSGFVQAMGELQDNYFFRYNVITNMVEYCKLDGEGKPTGNWEKMNDRQLSTVYSNIRLKGINVKESDVRNIIASINVSPDYNPFVEYIESLEVWDEQTDYIEALFDFIEFETEEDRAFCMPLLKKWFINAVALMSFRDDDNQIMPVLVGDQHVGKTHFCLHLLPPCLRKYIHVIMPGDNLNDKDVLIGMSEFAIILFDEFKLNYSSSNQMKALISSKDAKVRRAYGRYRESFRRNSSFIATTNEGQYIQQSEGDRRYPTVPVKGTKHIDENLPYEGAFAQADWMIKNKGAACYKTTAADSSAISKRNREHKIPTLCETILPLFFRKPLPHETGIMLTAGEILYQLTYFHSPELNAVNIGKTMKLLEFESTHTNAGTKYYVINVLAEEREKMSKDEGGKYRAKILEALKLEQEEEEKRLQEERNVQQLTLDLDSGAEAPF